ncbi:ABC transporter permease subunit [Streptantibioticus cattleyicolor]|uniref:Putative transmembrane transport protein n=1 Tax=Streptantibioticus cattleyicolor (strain ATCC 35852 / DSM 46488 / JCM 4925 / NBRC 14057 / NRRL 8057) TaxID=1003195 RepID=F8JMP7_STREN|nr:ABC transporter permease subunit [Streptantibioticus cattleyicolor]AEW98747.1 putative transmembrane transport protein [Streptantibioticus cattleyicolor NRRL 8057 = DSM 46488]CCB72201.1 conserved membrane protein of unknown function [Streptantibioticus cattleyicolor NRRL 8057 = DSM 46488]
MTPKIVPLRVVRLAPAPVRTPLRGLYRLVLRQNRTLGWGAVVCLVAAAGWAAQARSATAAAAREVAALCPVSRAACPAAMDRLMSAASSAQGLQFALLALPLLIGMFAGAPLVAQEVEHGTHRLVWTQSVSRTQWLTAKLLVPAAGLVALSTGASLIGTWLRAGVRHHTPLNYWGRYQDAVYNTFGVVPVAAALLAFALGVLTGVVLRRTIAAMAGAAGAYAVMALAFNWLRRYLQPVHTWVGTGGYNLDGDVWLISDGVVMADGTRVPYPECPPSGACESAPRTFELYHTPGQFWPMQWTQAALMLAVAALAVAVTYRLLHRRPF